MKAFLITPFSAERAGHESAGDFAAVQRAVAEAAQREGVELVHPARMHRPGFVAEQIESALIDADVVLAVITGQNPNVFYEIGYARRPAILVCRSADDVSFDVRHLRYWTYGGPGELATLADRLAAAIRASLAEPPNTSLRRLRPQRPPDVLRRDLTAVFVGPTERGQCSATLVMSFDEYREAFGAPLDSTMSFLAPAVRGFFENGGKRAVITRVVSSEAQAASFQTRVEHDYALAIWAKSVGAWGNRIEVRLRAGTRIGVRFTVVCHRGPGEAEPEQEDFDNSSLSVDGPNPLIERVNSESRFVYVRSDAFSLPLDLHVWLAGGADGPRTTATDYTTTALAVAAGLDGIDLLCVPDHVHPALTLDDRRALTDAIVEVCQRADDCLAVLATPSGEHDPERLKPRHETPVAAMYYPWLRTPLTGGFVPPIGHVAGAFARSDAATGIHAAPIGLLLEGVASAGLETEATPEVRDTLSRLGINVLATDLSSGRPNLVTAWNLAIDERRRHLNVTRFRLFLGRTIESGLRWTSFESNGESLWRRVTEQVTRFFQQLWDSGVLYGESPDEAFFVRCDETTMTANDVANGRLIILCGVAMSAPPASFSLQLMLDTRTAPAAGQSLA